MAPVGRAAVAPPQMRPPQMMGGPPAGMMQGIISFHYPSIEKNFTNASTNNMFYVKI